MTTQSENLIINTELDRMKETYGIEYTDYGFTGSESYRVTLAIIQDREDEFRQIHIENDTRSFNVSLDDLGGESLTIHPGTGVWYSKSADGPCMVRAWHDNLDIDNYDDAVVFGSHCALTPEIEGGLFKIRQEFEALFKKTENLLMNTRGPLTNPKPFLELIEGDVAA